MQIPTRNPWIFEASIITPTKGRHNMSEGLSRMEIKPLDFVNGTIKPRTIRDIKTNKCVINFEKFKFIKDLGRIGVLREM